MTVRQSLERLGPAEGTRPTKLLQMRRLDLGALSIERGWTRGAEIGVWKGAFSAALLAANPDLHMLCVDPWASYPGWLDTKNDAPEAPAMIAHAYAEAVERLTPLNCTIVRKFSAEAAADVPNGSLDFVFIDGNHVYDAVIEDLTLWSPKVKPGGLICGHDYRRFTNKPTIHVVDAVDAFTKARGIDPWFITAADKTPSFLWEAA